MNDAIYQKEEGQLIVKIFIDENAESPRIMWDNLGEILYLEKSRYILGDKGVSNEELTDAKNDNDFIVLPVFAYIHSSIVISTKGFSCPWDSGQCGVIRVSKAKVRKEYGWKKLTQKRIEKIKEYLTNEVKIFSQYLEGGALGFVIEDLNGNHVDSCWGFYDQKPEEIADEALKNVA